MKTSSTLVLFLLTVLISSVFCGSISSETLSKCLNELLEGMRDGIFPNTTAGTLALKDCSLEAESWSQTLLQKGSVIEEQGVWSFFQPDLWNVYDILNNHISQFALKTCGFDVVLHNVAYYCDIHANCEWYQITWRAIYNVFHNANHVFQFAKLQWFEGSQTQILENMYLRGKAMGAIFNNLLGIGQWNQWIFGV